MQLALVSSDTREAAPHLTGLCPSCIKDVISKCGEIKMWHWAHVSLIDCDPWWEPETIWHRNWKNNFPIACREVTLQKDGETHRADLRLGDTIIELQSKTLSTREIFAREHFYVTQLKYNLLWIYKIDGDLDGYYDDDSSNFKTMPKTIDGKTEWFSFRWKWMPRSLMYHHAPIFLDHKNLNYPDTLFRILKTYMNKGVWGGYGVYVPKKKFIEKMSPMQNSKLF